MPSLQVKRFVVFVARIVAVTLRKRFNCSPNILLIHPFSAVSL
jgi:hypothetical protein